MNCYELYAMSANNNGIDMSIWVPAIISVIALLLNIIFYIYVAPKITSRYQRKDKMFDICTKFMSFLSSIVSMDSFDGVPTKVRNYCLKIHMMFSTGTAPSHLAEKMENVFQMVKQRKTLQDESDISSWEESFRNEIRSLRCELSKYTGFFK